MAFLDVPFCFPWCGWSRGLPIGNRSCVQKMRSPGQTAVGARLGWPRAANPARQSTQHHASQRRLRHPAPSGPQWSGVLCNRSAQESAAGRVAKTMNGPFVSLSVPRQRKPCWVIRQKGQICTDKASNQIVAAALRPVKGLGKNEPGDHPLTAFFAIGSVAF